eukprot:CAMPEP_0170094850 /NCGR_PEP_ID=MMETSP0019_2-20121128/27550_1 /TAXON_ID=98059 /ORGANISM="Dinobryon sp., Strain UTEXLB2267" /LENGTH=508 /DNA_ID=CAMNT_0010316357 /DNA_START=78 /DNA_END=1604 /DNA_ORIENTATION=+
MSGKKRVRQEDLLAPSIKSNNKGGIPFVPDNFNCLRARLLSSSINNFELNVNGSCVIYWMSRDQRAADNHALQYAQSISLSMQKPLIVVFNLVPRFLEATIRQYGFMIAGLKEVEISLRDRGIPLHLMMGDPTVNVPAFVIKRNAIILVSDFSPLRVGKAWTQTVASALDAHGEKEGIRIPMVQVDAHNIVPCWVASVKLEYSARTIRGKIQTLLPQFLPDIPPPLQENPVPTSTSSNSSNSIRVMDEFEWVDWDQALASLEIDRSVSEVTWLTPGAAAALETLRRFGDERLKDYADKRNDPNLQVASNLSPYLHFGQISAQRAVIYVKGLKKHASGTDSFVEECVVRRELADNFCFYNPLYDSLDGCNDWAKESLNKHVDDPRANIYTRQQLEKAQTHDDLWNAAQVQMTTEGKMHGFLRMYWAKKILEWSNTPSEALATAIYLNDKYELDGRDPNGYVGCMWSIGGIHDQGWGERPIFGKIRYMNYEGCRRKFDVKKFVGKYTVKS